ncbi:MAG: DUF429 domain-containing protein [Anaerolineales bacterium]|nr:DUF429 domain-containing protein [Anaerolineales bacterium]
MFLTNATFMGIDPTAGQKPFAYAALDNNLRLLALGEGNIDDILAFAAGQHQAVAAVCAPRRPNQGLMERQQVRQRLTPPPRPGRWGDFRLVEYQMRQHHIGCPRTPASEQSCPGWMQMGFTLYRRLEEMGYQAYPSQEPNLQWLEVYPHACFCAMLGVIPFPKQTLEGRVQRQLVLFGRKLNIPDPMDIFEEITPHRILQGILPLETLYRPGELDALVAAYTAWLAINHPEQTSTLGDAEEGLVILPAAELKRHY